MRIFVSLILLLLMSGCCCCWFRTGIPSGPEFVQVQRLCRESVSEQSGIAPEDVKISSVKINESKNTRRYELVYSTQLKDMSGNLIEKKYDCNAVYNKKTNKITLEK